MTRRQPLASFKKKRLVEEGYSHHDAAKRTDIVCSRKDSMSTSARSFSVVEQKVRATMARVAVFFFY
jgi:hypothetical protein